MELIERVGQLREQINHHNHLYYIEGRIEISDREFDALLEELKQLEAQHPELVTPDSPTQRVGGAPVEGLAKVTHRVPMLSIDNSYNATDLRKFDTDLRKRLPGEPIRYVVELKIDGLAMSLRYEHGRLVVAATRGDGEVGDDVTHNVRTMPEIPLVLKGKDVPAVLEVRGEAYMTRAELTRVNEKREAAGLEKYQNPRNLAAGSIRLLNPKEFTERRLQFFGYSLGDVEGVDVTSHVDALKLISEMGFPVTPHTQICETIDAVIEYVESWNTKRAELPFETDGMVVKLDDIQQRRRLGATSKFPRWVRAYKFAAEQATTKLARIEIQVGRSGKLAPVAHFDPPVRLAGTTVSRATLHNPEEMERKDIRIGDTVVVEKAGDIIPQVVRVETEARTGAEVQFTFPTHCPVCGSPTAKLPNSPFIACTAKRTECRGQLKRQLLQFAAREAMNIDGLGKSLVDQLVAADLVEGLPDLYRLTEESLTGLERMGTKKAQKLLAALENSKSRGLGKVLTGMSIPMVAASVADAMAQTFREMDALMNASATELEKVEGIGSERARKIHDYFHDETTRQIIAHFKELGVKLTEDEIERPATGSGDALPLEGMTVVVTGSLIGYDRKEIEDVIRKHGGKATGSVSKNTDLVLAGEKAGSKLTKAQELGIRVVDEAEFNRLIGKDDG